MLERGGWRRAKGLPSVGGSALNTASRREPSGFVRGLFSRREKKPPQRAADSVQQFKPLFPPSHFPPTPNLRVAFPGTAGPGRGAFPRGGCTVQCRALAVTWSQRAQFRAASLQTARWGLLAVFFTANRGFSPSLQARQATGHAAPLKAQHTNPASNGSQ